jgi:hypothetical protein
LATCGAGNVTFGATHYNVTYQVRAVAERVANRYGCTWNTYLDHPPGLGLDALSVDWWGPKGRGDKLGRLKRYRITRYLRRSRSIPAWRWLINGRRGYYPDGSRFVPPGGSLWNAGHVHATFL